MRRLIRRFLGHLALRVARTAPGARLAALVVARAPWLLPVPRLAVRRGAVALRHPQPEVTDHVVVVPRRYVPDICALLAVPRGIEALIAVIEAAEAAAATLPAADRLLTFNVGRRQEVPQVHGHLLPVPTARGLLTETTGWIVVPRDDAAVAHAALEAATRSLGRCSPGVDGSLVVTGLGSGTWRFAASVAPTTGNE